MKESTIQELADAMIDVDRKTANMNRTTKRVDKIIYRLLEEKEALEAPYHEEIKRDLLNIGEIKERILSEWDGEKKTLECACGTIRFRTSTSLFIESPGMLLEDIVMHTSANEAANYISGFNKTAVKKYMGVHQQPETVAKLVTMTSVNLTI